MFGRLPLIPSPALPQPGQLMDMKDRLLEGKMPFQSDKGKEEEEKEEAANGLSKDAQGQPCDLGEWSEWNGCFQDAQGVCRGKRCVCPM